MCNGKLLIGGKVGARRSDWRWLCQGTSSKHFFAPLLILADGDVIAAAKRGISSKTLYLQH